MKLDRKWMMTSLALVIILLSTFAIPVQGQGGTTRLSRLIVSQVLTVTGTTNLTGAVTTVGNVTVGDDLAVTDDTTFAGTLIFTPATTQTVTMNDSITADSAVVLLSSAGTVNTSTVACGSNGAQVTYINVGSNSIVITDTGTLKISGNTTLGQYDNIVLQSVWGNCIEVAQADN